jgi:transcriptional regulator with XRE-family HTH domain
MLDDLFGKRTGERIQILRERKGLSRPVLAGLVGMSASWLKGIEQGRRLPPRLPVLVKLAEALAVGDITVLVGTDMNIGSAEAIPVASFARIPHDAVPAIREAVRDPMLTVSSAPASIDALTARVADAWTLWHTSRQHRTDVGRILPRLLTDARAAARSASGPQRRAASALLAEVYALVQHEIVWASEAELTWTVADRAMSAGQDADTPAALAGAAWTLGMVQRSAGDTDGALTLAAEGCTLLASRLEEGPDDLRGLAGALMLHAATTCARAGREGDAWRHWDQAGALAQQLPAGYHHPWTMFGTANIALHAVSINAELSKSRAAQNQAEQIDADEIPSRERRGRLGVEIARSYHQRRDYTAMLHWLEYAYQTAADSVHYSPAARQMAAEAVDHGGQLVSSRARALASSLGLPL